MVLAEKKVSFIKLGRVTSFTIENIRIIRQFLGVTFKIQKSEPEKAVQDKKEQENNSDIEEEGDEG